MSKRYELPPLPYKYDALEPHISAKIMELHHSKHHKTYVDGANKALDLLDRAKKGEEIDVKAVMRDLSFHVGGHVLHSIFWPNMSPNGGGKPGGRIADYIDREFGSFEAFQNIFTKAANTVEGVGWAVLAYDPLRDTLVVHQVEKHNLLHLQGHTPLLVIDVWEHAYYLQYLNVRPNYVKAWWNVVIWDDVDKRLERAINAGSPV